ncbi:MAG: histidinol-phosphate transaminase [Boseongicola sp.]|nr:histidinol-phosphate transaminase [Boseongicola sp.]
MTHSIKPQPGIDDIVLYKGGESRIDGHDEVLKLSSNENPFGPPETAKAALIATAATLHRYPSSDHASLRGAIAEVHGLDADRIICGAGSDEILTFLCQAYAGPGLEVIYTEHGFSMYRILALGAGATPVVVPERERVVDVDAILAAVTEATRLVFLTNPGNPTGTMISDDDMHRLANSLPDHVLLVLDGAYVEFAEGYDGGASLIDARETIVMTRTFSKLYGLGGLRVGWGYGPTHVIDTLNRLRGPFNLGVTQLATAEAAMRDRAFAEHYRTENARLRTWLAKELVAIGIPSDPSHANYILARFADADEANACEAALRRDGILVRKVAGYGLPEGLRITIGTEANCVRVRDSIERFRKGT